jgi:peptide/nickel transport system substrate-binding protein
MNGARGLWTTLLVVVMVFAVETPSPLAQEGQTTWAVHTTLVPTWFDPGETTIGTAFLVLYAIHDALVKPLPGRGFAPSLAESWTASPDGLVHEFVLRKGVRFHNGDPVTAADVKFSLDRYRGIFAGDLKERIAGVDTPDSGRVRFRLKQPWPDFMTYYGSLATGAAWIVPQRYVEKVGNDGFKKAPVGAGPYRFVSFTPGVELVLEAFDQHWRKTATVKRLVLRVMPDDATRLAALKRGEVDIAYAIRGPLAEELRRNAGLTLKPVLAQVTHWLYFPDQWDPKSPWHDRRVRLAASHAIDRQSINQAETLGFARLTGSIVPSSFEFYWQPPRPSHDPNRSRQLLAEAGYPNGFDAGDFFCDAGATYVGEPVANDLVAVGVRTKLRSIERAAFFSGWAQKKYRGLILGSSGAFGNAATRIEPFAVGGGPYAYGSYADIDGLFAEQGRELDPKRREATLHRIQQLVHDKVMLAPIWQHAGLNGVGPRVEESGLGLIAGYLFSAPYEDVRLKTK